LKDPDGRQDNELTESAVMGLNSKFTGVGFVPGDDTELDVGEG
jgi:hypothetical protein